MKCVSIIAKSTDEMIMDQHTALYGVLGYPISHSLSPIMHNAAFSASGLNAVYIAFETEDIEGCAKGMKALGIKGMSITIPHKSSVMPFLDEVDDLAKKIGAINTIINGGGKLIGYNTDALGALKALEDKIELYGKTCLIIGAGGAARAIGFSLKQSGVRLNITNRTVRRGEELASSLGCPFVHLREVEGIQVDLLIQTTPVGMYPHVDQCPVPEHILKEGMVVMDIIYNPLETRLLKMAKVCGCVTVSGLKMFINQGAEQFRLWTGINPPVNVMNHAVKEALLKRDERN